jgi:phage gp29-like protein
MATSAMPMRPVHSGVLAKDFFADRIPRSENERTHYGKSLDMQRIDFALRSAERGRMAPITDISREQLTYDGHLSAVLQKRINRLAALDWDLVPASGARVHGKKAELYAGFVRAQLEAIPRFRDAIIDLAWGVYDNRSALELDWRFFGHEWNLIGLNWIHPRRLSFGPNRDVRVIDPRSDGGDFRDVGFPLEQVPYKFCTYTPRLFNDYPEREGLAIRTLYWSYFGRVSQRERMTLQELFGRPWRVVKSMAGAEAITLNDDSAKAAYETVQRLGFHNTARLPHGWDLQIIQPFTGAGQVSGEIIGHSEKVQSKLVLGSTGTTDAVSTGLGSSIGNAHLSEEDLIVWSDARRAGETIEDQITDAIIAVNFGPGELDHAPRFIIRTEPPISREEEGNRLAKALDLGMPVTLEEMREKLGVQEVRLGEPYVIKVQRPPEFGAAPMPPMPEIVYAPGKAPVPGELAEPPMPAFHVPSGGDNGLPPAPSPDGALPPAPLALPAGSQGPDDDEPDAVAALCEKMNELQIDRCEHGRVNLCAWCSIERERDVEIVDGEPKWIIKWKPLKKPLLHASKAAWLRLLAHAQPQLTPNDLEVIGQAELDELRLIVGTRESPPA